MCGANDGGATEVDAPLSHKMRCGFNHAAGMSWRDAVSRWSMMCCKLKEADVIDHWTRCVDIPC